MSFSEVVPVEGEEVLHQFILSYSTKTGRWTWDTDQEEASFDGGSIYVPSLMERTNSSVSESIKETDTRLSALLSVAIESMNETIAQAEQEQGL